jgi:hypothetical protein
VTAVIGSSELGVDIPAGNPIAQLVIATPTATIAVTPIEPQMTPLPGTALELSAADNSGQPVHQLAQPVTITISFRSPAGVNPLAAEIYTIDVNGQTEELVTTVQPQGHGAYAATATTSHLSPFVVLAPAFANPGLDRQIYLPFVANRPAS